jgi:plastocyanin
VAVGISLRATLALALAACAIAAGCGGSDGSSNSSAPKVTVADFSFSPDQKTVNVGQTVTWTNEGQTEHTVKGLGFFSTKALGHGASFSHKFRRAGRFPYLCTLHPGQMRGTVVVQG